MNETQSTGLITAKEHERVARKKKFEEEDHLKNLINENIIELNEKQEQLMRLQIQQENFKLVLDEEANLYEELGKMKDKY